MIRLVASPVALLVIRRVCSLCSESQVRLRTDGRRRPGDAGGAVDDRAFAAHLQVPGDQRGEVSRPSALVVTVT